MINYTKKIDSVTPSQMREIDERMESEMSISIPKMMENAGRSLATISVEEFMPKKVAVLAGKGNNGGGGLVAARHLLRKGIDVIVLLASENLNGITDMQRARYEQEGGKILKRTGKDYSPDIIIDALLGYSSKGNPRKKYADLIRWALKTGKPVISNDIPTGFDVETGEWKEPCFKDAIVMTEGLPKKNMMEEKGIKKIYACNILVPDSLYEKIGITHYIDFKGKEFVLLR